MVFNLSLFSSNVLLFAIVSFLLQITLVLLYLGDFKLFISRLVLILLFISVLFISFVFICDNVVSNIILSVSDKVNDVNVGANSTVNVNNPYFNVNISREALNGLYATGAIGLTAGAVGKAVAKTPMPPLQKAGFVIGGAAVGGALSVITNYSNNYLAGSSGTSSSSNVGNSVSKFIDNSELSPFQGMLFWLEALDYICLYIAFILVIQLMFKLYFKDSINLGLSKLLGNNFNNKLEYYLNKMISLNKKMSVFWIWFGFSILMCSVSGSVYFINLMYIYLDRGISTHNPISNSVGATVYKSIEDGLLSLNIVNCICFTIIISLIIILLFRFHFDKKISTFYIWVLVIALIVTLAVSGYIFNELYTNLDSYVNMYNNKL